MCAIIFPFRREFQTVGKALRQRDVANRTRTSKVRTIRNDIRNEELAEICLKLKFLEPKIERYRPNAWWSGAFLVVVRLMQTSLMVFIDNQVSQAALGSSLTLLVIYFIREMPLFRGDSDNTVALLAQW